MQLAKRMEPDAGRVSWTLTHHAIVSAMSFGHHTTICSTQQACLAPLFELVIFTSGCATPFLNCCKMFPLPRSVSVPVFPFLNRCAQRKGKSQDNDVVDMRKVRQERTINRLCFLGVDHFLVEMRHMNTAHLLDHFFKQRQKRRQDAVLFRVSRFHTHHSQLAMEGTKQEHATKTGCKKASVGTQVEGNVSEQGREDELFQQSAFECKGELQKKSVMPRTARTSGSTRKRDEGCSLRVSRRTVS